MQPRGAVLTVSLLLVAASCGGGTDGAEAEPVPTASIVPTTVPDRAADDGGDIEQTCAELQIVQNLSDEISESTNDILVGVLENPTASSEAETIASFKTLAGELADSLPDVLAAYDRAAAVAPPGIDAEIRAVADGTARLTPALVAAFEQVDTAADLGDIEGIFASPELQDAATDAGIASFRLDNFTNPNCGFQFSNS